MLCHAMLCCACYYAVFDCVACAQTVAPRLVAEDSANNYLPSQSSSASGVTDSPASTPSAEQAELAQGPFLRVSVPASTAELEPQPPAVAESHSDTQAVPASQSTLVSLSSCNVSVTPCLLHLLSAAFGSVQILSSTQYTSQVADHVFVCIQVTHSRLCTKQ